MPENQLVRLLILKPNVPLLLFFIIFKCRKEKLLSVPVRYKTKSLGNMSAKEYRKARATLNTYHASIHSLERILFEISSK